MNFNYNGINFFGMLNIRLRYSDLCWHKETYQRSVKQRIMVWGNRVGLFHSKQKEDSSRKKRNSRYEIEDFLIDACIFVASDTAFLFFVHFVRLNVPTCVSVLVRHVRTNQILKIRKNRIPMIQYFLYFSLITELSIFKHI